MYLVITLPFRRLHSDEHTAFIGCGMRREGEFWLVTVPRDKAMPCVDYRTGYHSVILPSRKYLVVNPKGFAIKGPKKS